MCVPIVPGERLVVNPIHGPLPVDEYDASSAETGSAQPIDRSKRRRQARRSVDLLTPQEIIQTRFDPELEPLSEVYLLELASTHRRGRRCLPRQSAVVLSNEEREAARRTLLSVASCGKSYRPMVRYDIGPGGIKETRAVIQERCHQRWCSTCGDEMRRREAARVEAGWRLFVTCGVPDRLSEVSASWRRIRRARAKLIKELEREASDPCSWRVRLWPEDIAASQERQEASGKERQRLCPLDYAWVLEPHQTGYPHLHLVLTACFVDYRWLKALWSRCIGSPCRWLYVATVSSPAGVCRYLSKYISKSQFSLDLCAVMRGQRMWGTSLPLKKKGPREWWDERATSFQKAGEEVENPEEFGTKDGWKLESAKVGAYAVWTRQTGCEPGIEGWIAVAIPLIMTAGGQRRGGELKKSRASDPDKACVKMAVLARNGIRLVT